LSLSSNKLHSQSKQESKNDLIKGEKKYPRIITAVLNFLQYHNIRGHSVSRTHKLNIKYQVKTTFTQDENRRLGDEKEKIVKLTSQT